MLLLRRKAMMGLGGQVYSGELTSSLRTVPEVLGLQPGYQCEFYKVAQVSSIVRKYRDTHRFRAYATHLSKIAVPFWLIQVAPVLIVRVPYSYKHKLILLFS
jgi:hypothetical protein